jgi:hypothetical protein
MKRYFILTLFLLTACAPSSPTINPAFELERAKVEAQYYEAQLTATAQAPILEVTRAAAAVEMTMQVQNLQGTQTAIPLTSTAQMWTPTVTPTPTINVTGTLAVEQMNAEVESMRLETERQQTTNTALAVAPYILVAFSFGLAMFLGFVSVKRFSMMPTPINADGKLHPVLNVLDGVVIDLDRMANGAGQVSQKWLAALPEITAERQHLVTSQAQTVDLQTRVKRLPSSLVAAQAKPMIEAPKQLTAPVVSDDDINMPLPPWEFITRWDGTSKPLGFGKAGLITAKSASPHILISGMTGSGKTIYMMRTLTATSLANGSQVVNIGYSNAGYGVFEHHANFHSVQLPNPSDVIECLAQVYEELKSRKALIGGETIEWEYWPGGQPPRPFLDVHLDELGNMAEDIFIEHGPAFTKELWSYISRIANEGRKVGIRFVAALQDPTSKSMDLRFRRNCTLVAFRQGDRTQSDTFIGAPGAEQLSVGHFIARTDSLVIGGGFSPTDTELLQYLSAHKVVVAEKPKWIEGVAHSVVGNQLSAQEEPVKFIEPTASESLPIAADEIKAMAESIRSQWTPGLSKTKAAKLLGFPQYGGSYIGKVDRVIEYLTSTTTIERNSPGNGVFEAIPA